MNKNPEKALFEELIAAAMQAENEVGERKNRRNCLIEALNDQADINDALDCYLGSVEIEDFKKDLIEYKEKAIQDFFASV